MEKEFVPFELAKELKKLGFEEHCLAAFDLAGNMFLANAGAFSGRVENCTTDNNIAFSWTCFAPLWQQAFDWSREKYGLYHQVVKGYGWEAMIRNDIADELKWHDGTYNTTDEARKAALEKLIEIVSQC